MPSSKIKAKNAAAHQHDKRHESGLAAPGKRVVRQRSQNNLANGHINGRPTTSAEPVQLANTTAIAVTDHNIAQTRLVDARSVSRTSAPSKTRDDAEYEYGDRDRTNSDASHDGMYHYGDVDEGQQDDMAYYATSDSRRAGPGQQSKLAVVSTILTYYPLRDAISILILLLSLPTTLVLIVQTLFASLTFVPPTAGISLPSIKDIFNASSLGYPALATILFVDLLCYVVWTMVWHPVQNVLLDLSQAVVAVSLSGAAASTGGPTYSIATCSALVCVVHVLRYKAIHLTALDYLRSVLHKTDLGVNLSASFTSYPFFKNNNINYIEHNWIITTIRTILGIHILSQGLTTCVRRALASQNDKPAAAPALTRTDTEAAVGHDSLLSRSTGNIDTTPNSTMPNGPSPLARDGRARESGRRRRKQAIEIRGNQPLWAAIASTKVTFVKEMEQRDAADDEKEADTMEKFISSRYISAKPLMNRIWVSSILDTEVSLCAELSFDKSGDSSAWNGDDCDYQSLHVRLNGAIWNSVKLTPACSSAGSKHISIEVFRLAPRVSYNCGIFVSDSLTPLCSVTFVTQLAQATEQVAPIAPPPVVHTTLRPSSPASTLRRSIEQASASLAEAKNKTKKTRKDQRAAYSDIRKEIKDLKSKLDNGGGNDDRQARRLQQFTQHKNQAEEAAVQILRQIDELGDIPADDVAAADVSKEHWQAANNQRLSAQKQFDAVKSNADREARELKSEISAAEVKRERLSTRHLQRKDELASAAAKHQADLTARQKHSIERAARRDEQEKLEGQLRFHIASMSNETDMHNAKAIEAYQQGQVLELGWTGHSSPPTPDNARLVANGISQDLSNGFYGTQHFDASYPQQQQGHAPRGRSSSMLSDYSDFIGEAEDGTIHMPHDTTWTLQKTGFGTAIIDARKENELSSGSSGTNESTASNSPRPDATARPFVPSKMSPIAPPARKTASPATNAPPSRLTSSNDR